MKKIFFLFLLIFSNFSSALTLEYRCTDFTPKGAAGNWDFEKLSFGNVVSLPSRPGDLAHINSLSLVKSEAQNVAYIILSSNFGLKPKHFKGHGSLSSPIIYQNDQVISGIPTTLKLKIHGHKLICEVK